MATYSPSPRERPVELTTPTHSPVHSTHSSTSSLLSFHHLTLHEYRKQQNSPASQATPPGKTLRRKAAASGLKAIERAPSVTKTPLSSSRILPRPLQISRSTHSLFTYQQLPPSPPDQDDLSVDEIFRSQSAEPREQSFAAAKVGDFKPIKRLPKPVSSGRGSLHISPAPLASVTSHHHRLSTSRTTSTPWFDNPNWTSDDISQPTPSSFSLSRFPRPPNFADPAPSPPFDGNVEPHVNATSFASTAPVTPPATPAVIHYRGVSFDLVNPRGSLVLENIVTPSRDFDSSDYLPLDSSDEVEFSEMAPKRPLYGDLSSAHASITSRHGDETPPRLDMNLPVPPSPAALSPGSSAFASPAISPETHTANSWFTDRKKDNESRFSLKQLTRSITNRFSKTAEKEAIQEQELQEFTQSRVSVASAEFDGEYPRPLERSYRVIYPEEPSSPASAHPTRRVLSAPLTSMVPDISPNPAGPSGAGPSDAGPSDAGGQEPVSTEPQTKPYYEDISSIYPSSSVYTSESRRQSTIPGSRYSRYTDRYSNPFYYSTSGLLDGLPKDDESDNLSQQPTASRRTSRPLAQKTDTISKFIEEYQGDIGSDATRSVPQPEENTHHPAPAELYSDARGLSQFKFDFARPQTSTEDTRSVEVGRAAFRTHPGAPPAETAPLAPEYEEFEDVDLYDQFPLPGPSGMSSSAPSYGDTRQLLQVSSLPVFPPRSSSYSQPGASSTPQDALQRAERIFANADVDIPAMWSRRASYPNLPRDNEQQQERDELAEYESQEPTDWETVAETSPQRNLRMSVGESLANYSSSDGSHSSRDSKGFSGPLPIYQERTSSLASSPYGHPSPLRTNPNPFTSSPPQLPTGYSLPGMSVGGPQTPMNSSPPASSTVPALIGRSPDLQDQSPTARQKFIPFQPWNEPYPFSEKLTQELIASGPNEEVLYEGSDEDVPYDGKGKGKGRAVSLESDDSGVMEPMRLKIPTEATPSAADSARSAFFERFNSFEKLTRLGPKGNLTGSPQGTGMHATGSSVADNSSPGAALDSSPPTSSVRASSGFRIFRSAAARNVRSHAEAGSPYMSSGSSSSFDSLFRGVEGRQGTVTRILPRLYTPPDLKERAPSQATLHDEESPFADPPQETNRSVVRPPITPRNPRRVGSRAAVHGQTRLREMMLAPGTGSSSSGRSRNDSRVFGTGHSARPSTTNTHTPLRPTMMRPIRTGIATEHSPHLLCPERLIDPEEEAARLKLSWVLFAFFCLLPPALILYRWMGDSVIINLTNGRLTHVSRQPKRLALGAGIVINVGLAAGILMPILIAHAAGAV